MRSSHVKTFDAAADADASEYPRSASASPWTAPRHALPLLLGCVAYTAQKSTQPTAHGIIVSWGSGRTAASVELAVAGESAFRPLDGALTAHIEAVLQTP